VGAQIGALGEVLTQEPIGVFVRAALPGRAGVAEQTGAPSDWAIVRWGHFGSLIPGERPQQRRRHVDHPRFQCVVQGVAVSLRKMQQSDHPGLPFRERADRRALVLTDDVGSDRGAVPRLLSVRLPGPPSAPDVRLSPHPALPGRPLLRRNQGFCVAGPRCGDVARPPPVSGNRHCGGVEHDEPIDSRSVTWPAGQEPPVEFRPVEVLVPFQQPLSDSMPGVGIEIAEGCLGHSVAEVPAPAPERRVEASEEISK
jgi:hypothetical protein